VSLLVGYQPTGAVGYISYNMGTFDLPDAGPECKCVYFRQIKSAHVITITYHSAECHAVWQIVIYSYVVLFISLYESFIVQFWSSHETTL